MTEYSYSLLEIDGPDDDGILTVAVNRPDAKNALDTAVIGQIGEVLQRAEADAAVRALVITATGKVFGIGADIPEILGQGDDQDQLKTMIEQGHRVFRALEQSTLPTCAAINGVFCLGGSLELALACTLRVASKKARLGLPEVTIGLTPGYGGTQRLARLIGKGRAMEMILTGEPIRAEEAARIGLINREVDGGDEVKEAKALLKKVLDNAPIAVRLAMRAISDGLDLPLDDALSLERETFVEVRATNDAAEGLASTQEKRKPTWKGR